MPAVGFKNILRVLPLYLTRPLPRRIAGQHFGAVLFAIPSGIRPVAPCDRYELWYDFDCKNMSGKKS